MPNKTLQSGDLTLDIDKRQITGRLGTSHLTPKECQLLSLLTSNPGEVLSQKLLMKEVWNTDYLDDTCTLDVHICRLRKKIKEVAGDSWYWQTVHGVGYRFEPSEE